MFFFFKTDTTPTSFKNASSHTNEIHRRRSFVSKSRNRRSPVARAAPSEYRSLAATHAFLSVGRTHLTASRSRRSNVAGGPHGVCCADGYGADRGGRAGVGSPYDDVPRTRDTRHRRSKTTRKKKSEKRKMKKNKTKQILARLERIHTRAQTHTRAHEHTRTRGNA